MAAIETLGDLRQSGYRSRPVKQEIRDNLVRKLQAGDALFPGIIGYDETVIPQLVNAILSRHNFILLGLRGQAKSRILRGLADLLDEKIPVVPGCEIHDDPLAPLCASCRARLAKDARPHLARLRLGGHETLQRDPAPEPRIVAEEHLAHAPCPEFPEDLVRSDRRAYQGTASKFSSLNP